MTDHGVTPADMIDDDDRVAALFGASSTAEDDAHQSPPFDIDDDDTVTLGGIFAGRPSDHDEPPPGRSRTRTSHSPRSGRRRTPSRPRVPRLNIGLPQFSGALLLRIVSVVGILVIGWLFVHLVLSARHGDTPVNTGAAAATPTGPTVMPDARHELLTARRVVQQAQRTAARRAAAVRAAARQRAAHRRAAALRAARRRAARARARRATSPPPPPAPRSTTAGTTTSHSNPTTRPRAPAPAPASGGTQDSCTPGDLGC